MKVSIGYSIIFLLSVSFFWLAFPLIHALISSLLQFSFWINFSFLCCWAPFCFIFSTSFVSPVCPPAHGGACGRIIRIEMPHLFFLLEVHVLLLEAKHGRDPRGVMWTFFWTPISSFPCFMTTGWETILGPLSLLFGTNLNHEPPYPAISGWWGGLYELCNYLILFGFALVWLMLLPISESWIWNSMTWQT